jgi:hypothetical protein
LGATKRKLKKEAGERGKKGKLIYQTGLKQKMAEWYTRGSGC